MMDLYCKPFVFKVTHYERWRDSKCISKGSINLKIVAVPFDGYISFRILGKLNLDIEYGFSLNMSPVRQMSDYIQYGVLPTSMNVTTVPGVCKQ